MRSVTQAKKMLMTVAEYLKRKEALMYTTFVITPTGNFYEIDGTRIPEKTFKQANALPLSLVRTNCENPDKTFDWLKV